MCTIRSLFVALVGLLCAWPLAVRGGEETAKARPGLTVWDTQTASAGALAPAALAAQNGWTAIPTDQTAPSFKGDAVVTSGRLWVVLRKQSAAAEVYVNTADSIVSRAGILPLGPGNEAAARLESLAVAENAKGGICLDAGYKTAKGAALAIKWRLKKGEVILETEPGPGAAALHVDCTSQFAVLPDFFADDIVLNPAKIPLDQIEVPSENFLLQLAAGGDAIVMNVFENREQEVKLSLTGTGEQRVISGAEITFGEANPKPLKEGQPPPGRKIWLACLEAPKIWYTMQVKATDAGKIMPLGWKMPFLADWRVDFTRPDELVDSWEMLLQYKEGGPYTKAGLVGGEGKIDLDRKHWTTVLGSFLYPCWSDSQGAGYIGPLRSAELHFAGPVVIYPISRVSKTAPDIYTMVDIVRNTLGVGPCQYVLDVEGQTWRSIGRATCDVHDTLKEIYKNGQQKDKRAQVDKLLDDGLNFVKFIRARIGHYVEFAHKMQAYLAEQKKAHPELSAQLGELEKLAGEPDKCMAAVTEKIKTPDVVAEMNADFRKNVLDDTGPDAAKKCEAYGSALVDIGGNQDHLVGRCRWAVKSLRQRAGLLMALDPKMAQIATEVRNQAQEALRGPAGHEFSRH